MRTRSDREREQRGGDGHEDRCPDRSQGRRGFPNTIVSAVMIRVLKRAWIPLLIVLVVVIAGFAVQRIRTFFGAEGIIVTPKNFADDPEPFNPKVVKYEIF